MLEKGDTTDFNKIFNNRATCEQSIVDWIVFMGMVEGMFIGELEEEK